MAEDPQCVPRPACSAQDTDSGVWFESQLAVWPWAMTFLCFSFFLCKMGMIIVYPLWGGDNLVYVVRTK